MTNPTPTAEELLKNARNALLDLRADAERWEEDVDVDMDSNGRAVVTVRYHTTIRHESLEALCEALGIRVPFDETAGDAIDREIEIEAAVTP